MLVHTYFLNLRNKAFEESGGWLCWESTERGLGNPALQTFYCDDFFFGSLSHVSYVRNFAFYLRYCFHTFLGFPLCLFLQKKKIVLSSKYLRTAVHSLHCLLWNELSPLLCGIKVCLGWAPVTSGHPPMRPGPQPCAMKPLSSQQVTWARFLTSWPPSDLFWKKNVPPAFIDTKLITTRSLCPGNNLPCGERDSPSCKVSISHRRYLWVMGQTNMLVNHKFSCADAALRRALPCGESCPTCPKKAVMKSLISEDVSQVW